MKPRFNLTQLATLTFFFSLLMIASCQKENSQSGSDDQQEQDASMASSESDAEAELIFNGVFDDAVGVNDEVGMAGVGVFGRVTACYTVTVTHTNPPDVFPVKIVVDFGTTGCLGVDGHIRKGKVITEYSGRLLTPGAKATTTFDGFYVDSIKVEGTHKITNTSNGTSNREFTIEVIGAKLTKPSGNYTEWKSNKVITQTEGLGTPFMPLDDIFSARGTASGNAKREALRVAWESSTTEPLIKKFSCRWIVKGRVRTIRTNNTANSPWVALLDFGNGDCDNQAIITLNGVSHQITLR